MLSISRILEDKMRKSAHSRFFRRALREPLPSEFTSYPEPTNSGDYARGLRLLSGEFLHESEMLSAPNGNIWDLQPVSSHVLKSLHSFDWMDDLAAVGTAEANRKMREWTKSWLEQYSKGDGPGWDLEVVSWRLIRLITHAQKLMPEGDLLSSERIYQTLGVHINFVCEYYTKAKRGLEYIVSLTAWTFAALSLPDYKDDLEDLIVLLDDQASFLLHGNKVEIPSRNPEELSEIFSLLVWIEAAIYEKGFAVGEAHDDAIDHMGQGLRSLRLGTGKIVEAHGGGPGQIASIERALALAQVHGRDEGRVLGFAHMRAGKLAVIMDCDQAASGGEFENAAASTLGLWVSDGNQMLIGSEGCAKNHTINARISNQESLAYSTLSINGQSSSEFDLIDPKNTKTNKGAYIKKPSIISYFHQEEGEGRTLIDASQDGFIERFGLKHDRAVSIDHAGDLFIGIDRLLPNDPKAERLLKSLLKKNKDLGLPYAIQFILGPKVQASLDASHSTVTLQIPGGRTWFFKQSGGQIAIEDRAIYDIGRINSIPTKAIVVYAQLTQNEGLLSWEFQAFN